MVHHKKISNYLLLFVAFACFIFTIKSYSQWQSWIPFWRTSSRWWRNARQKNFKPVRLKNNFPKVTKQPIITIWIHGTIFPHQRLIGFGKRLLKKPKSIFSLQKKETSKIYNATSLHPKSHLRNIATVLFKADPNNYPIKTFYTLRWSGKLSVTERITASKTLFDFLTDIAKKYSPKAFIRIITHSHGGNVALFLGKFKQPNDGIIVDELILLACPVQRRTADFAHNPIFKSVYSLYSETDLLQRIDIQGGLFKKQKFFSERKFKDAPHIKQIHVLFNNKELWHNEFISHAFLSQLPTTIFRINSWLKENPNKNSNILIQLPRY